MREKREDEKDIVWLEDVSGYRYVRDLVEMCHFRTRKPSWHSRAGRLVGHATLTSDARSRSSSIYRRCFWLADHDPYAGGGYPCEGVDPATVRPNRQAQCSDRCAGSASQPRTGRIRQVNHRQEKDMDQMGTSTGALERSREPRDRVVGPPRPPITPEVLGRLQLELEGRSNEPICAITCTLENSISIKAAATALECQRRGIKIIPDCELLFEAQIPVDGALRRRITRHRASMLKLLPE